LTQPPLPDGNDAPGTATDRTVAAPSPRATTTTTAPSQGDNDDDTDNDDAPTPEPAAKAGSQPEDIGDSFLPHLPNDQVCSPDPKCVNIIILVVTITLDFLDKYGV
jgi:hypothetical protein